LLKTKEPANAGSFVFNLCGAFSGFQISMPAPCGEIPAEIMGLRKAWKPQGSPAVASQ
jgi:hypothetical protein